MCKHGLRASSSESVHVMVPIQGAHPGAAWYDKLLHMLANCSSPFEAQVSQNENPCIKWQPVAAHSMHLSLLQPTCAP